MVAKLNKLKLHNIQPKNIKCARVCVRVIFVFMWCQLNDIKSAFLPALAMTQMEDDQ